MTTIREDRQKRLYPGLHDQAAAPPPPPPGKARLPCSQDGCTELATRRNGMCNRHYRRVITVSKPKRSEPAPKPAAKKAAPKPGAPTQTAPLRPPVAPRPAVSRTAYVKQIRDIIARHRSSYGGISGMYIPSMTQDLIDLFDEIAGTGRQIDDLRRAAEEQTTGHSRSDWNDPLWDAKREETS